jgi:hypothetical protein
VLLRVLLLLPLYTFLLAEPAACQVLPLPGPPHPAATALLQLPHCCQYCCCTPGLLRLSLTVSSSEALL